MSLTPGTRLGPYEVVSAIGAGGMGEVYRARDARLQRDVAIKVLPEAFATDEARLSRFEQEALATAALNHPNILVVFDIGREGRIAYVVAELLEGQTLREVIEAGRLPLRKAVDYASQIASGLAAAHAKGIVHRDLKPENVFVTTQDRAKILDFGLAKWSPASVDVETRIARTGPGMVLGTLGYMAPEQVRGQAVDHRADIFSFGAVLYEMIAGCRAFQGATAADTMTAILKEAPADVTDSGVAVPSSLARVVDRCLEKAPASRFQSASDLAFALQALGSDARSGSSISAASAGLPKAREKQPWMRVAGVALAVRSSSPRSGARADLARAPTHHRPLIWWCTIHGARELAIGVGQRCASGGRRRRQVKLSLSAQPSARPSSTATGPDRRCLDDRAASLMDQGIASVRAHVRHTRRNRMTQ